MPCNRKTAWFRKRKDAVENRKIVRGLNKRTTRVKKIDTGYGFDWW